MSIHSDNMVSGAAVLSEAHGETVTYNPSGGDPVSLMAIPYAKGPTAPASGDKRTGGYQVELLISRAELSAVTLNGDTVEIPNHWLGKAGGGTSVIRVGADLSDQASSAYWHLRLASTF